jgi:hypothetical protein
MKVKTLPIEPKGQALITLLFFMSIAVTILSASALILATNIQASSTTEKGLIAYAAAESGAEDGMLHLLRQPSGSPTTLSYDIDDAHVDVTITPNVPNSVIVSKGTYNGSVRKIQIQTTNTNGVIAVSSWQEIN